MASQAMAAAPVVDEPIFYWTNSPGAGWTINPNSDQYSPSPIWRRTVVSQAPGLTVSIKTAIGALTSAATTRAPGPAWTEHGSSASSCRRPTARTAIRAWSPSVRAGPHSSSSPPSDDPRAWRRCRALHCTVRWASASLPKAATRRLRSPARVASATGRSGTVRTQWPSRAGKRRRTHACRKPCLRA
jgi:hypothetical protein